MLTFRDNRYDLAAYMTQHDEPDNKKGEKSKAAWGGFKCHFKTPAQMHFQGERHSTHTQSGTAPYELYTESLDRTPDQQTRKIVDVRVCCNPTEKNNY